MKSFRNSLILLALIPFSAVALEVDTSAGKIDLAIGNNTDATQLVVKGSVDARDFNFISEKMSNLTSIDLSEAHIEAYKIASVKTGETNEASQLPDLAFFGSKLTSVVLPADLSAIGESAFAGCKGLANVEIPSGVSTIGNYAFYDCDAITAATIPASVTEIGEYAFARCDALASVEIKGDVATIKKSIFDGCASLSKATLPASVTEIGESAFMDCKSLAEFTFPTAVAKIGDKAFFGASLVVADMSECSNLYEIGDWSFASNSAIKNIKLPSKTEVFGKGALAFNAVLTDMELPTSMTAIPDYMFAYSPSIQPHLIPGAIATIGKYSFAHWDKTSNFTFPDNTEFIDDYAFEGWTSVKNYVSTLSIAPVLGEDVFAGIDKSQVILYVQNNDMILVYQAAEQWKEFDIKSLHGTNIDAVDPNDSILATFSGSVLHVKTSFTVAEATLFDTTGATLTRVAPGSDLFTIDTDAFSTKFYILVIKDEKGNSRVAKLARK